MQQPDILAYVKKKKNKEKSLRENRKSIIL